MEPIASKKSLVSKLRKLLAREQRQMRTQYYLGILKALAGQTGS